VYSLCCYATIHAIETLTLWCWQHISDTNVGFAAKISWCWSTAALARGHKNCAIVLPEHGKNLLPNPETHRIAASAPAPCIEKLLLKIHHISSHLMRLDRLFDQIFWSQRFSHHHRKFVYTFVSFPIHIISTI
jgi:hypothetical protein